jgi:hypothetical protein
MRTEKAAAPVAPAVPAPQPDNSDNMQVARIHAALAVASCVLTVALGVAWMDADPAVELKTKKHILLSSCGFYASQVLAMMIWTLWPGARDYAKLLHIVFQTLALCSVFAGIGFIVEHKKASKGSSMTTMHSWVGVMAVVMFALNYFWGFIMAGLTMYWPEAPVRKMANLLSMHRALGLIAFGLAAISVVTGINNHIGPRCTNLAYGVSADANPADHFGDIPVECRMAYGMGITTLLAAMFSCLCISYRNDLFNRALLAMRERLLKENSGLQRAEAGEV